MAIVENLFTGNGATVLFPFSFQYLETDHVKASLNGTLTTAFTLDNPTTVRFNTAPATGVAIRIFRDTPEDEAEAIIFSGSAIRASDLNRNNTQLLYLAQESGDSASKALAASADAVETADGVAGTANDALDAATEALATANAIDAKATEALATANAADDTANAIDAKATTALSTANSALAAANSAVNTANAADATADDALFVANGVDAKAQTALNQSTAAVNTANAALPRAGGTLTGNVDNTSNGYFDLPAGTTAQRPGTPNPGMVRFNTETSQFEGYSSEWGVIGGGAKGSSGNQVFFENDQTVTSSYSITPGKNAVSAGPITVNNGVTVTIPSNSTWVIV
jgi:hypothetical protein